MGHWDGTEGDLYTTGGGPFDLNGIWVKEADTLAVGDFGTAVRWTGREWTSLANPPSFTLHTVWGNDINNLWGAGFRVVHWDGSEWTTVVSRNYRFLGICGSSVDD